MTQGEIYKKIKSDFERNYGVEIDDKSVCGFEFQAVSAAISELYVKFDETLKQLDINTAYSDGLDRLGREVGILRNTGSKAVGEVTFSKINGYTGTVTIPKGARVCKRGDVSTAFLTDSELVISGSATSGNVTVTAVDIGEKYNIGIGEIAYLVNAPVGVASVTNAHTFTGGSDYQSDESYRAMICNAFYNVDNNVNREFYINTAKKTKGITTANAVNRTTGSVNVYISNNSRNVTSEMLNDCSTAFNDKRQVGVTVNVSAAQNVPFDFRVTCSYNPLYSLSQVKSNIKKAVTEYFESMEVGQDLEKASLEKVMSATAGVSAFSIPSNGFNADNVVLCGDDQIMKLNNIYIA